MAVRKSVVLGVAAVSLAAITVFSTGPDFLTSAQSVADFANPYVVSHENTQVPAEFRSGDKAVLRLPFVIVILLIVIAMGGAIHIYRKSWLDRDGGDAGAAAERDTLIEERRKDGVLIEQLRKELVRTGQSFSRIGRQGYASGQRRLNFKRIECSFDIDGEGNTLATQVYTAETGADPGQFWEFYVDDVIDPAIASQEALAIKAVSLTPDTDLELLSIDLLHIRKRMMIWFLPEVAPHVERSFSITYTIPHWFRNLYDNAMMTDEWTWSHKSRDPEDPVDVSFTFDVDTSKGMIDAKIAHQRVLGENLRREILPDGRNRIAYTISGAPVGNLNWALHFTRHEW